MVRNGKAIAAIGKAKEYPQITQIRKTAKLSCLGFRQLAVAN
jgi:hypothetical protein